MLSHIMAPVTIAGTTLKNRVVRTAHTTNLGQGTISDDLIAYHVERARYGVGMSMVETLSVHSSSSPSPIDINHPEIGDRYPRMVAAIAPHGMKLFHQLWHAGANIRPADAPPWSASDLPSPLYGVAPIPMTKAMIDTVVEAFGRAARKCYEWGIDGVEVHGGHGYLPAQFLSPLTNHREDEYGGSAERRARFLTEVLEAIRSEVPRDFPVGVRLSPDAFAGGLEAKDVLQVALALEQRKLIDFVDLSVGCYYNLNPTVGAMHEPSGYELPSSEQISRPLTIPTIVTGRFRTLQECDEVVRSGIADMVSIVRGLIADPQLVSKTLAGREAEVRPCIGCNQGCIGGLFSPDNGFRMGCVVNPGAGRENSIGGERLVQAATARKILVIGGGPAGMEAARVAALRGHHVILAEADRVLGGNLRLAARAPTRHSMRDYLVWQEAEIYRLGVDVRLSCYVEIEDVAAFGADSIIVATGAIPRSDALQISNPGEPLGDVGAAHVLDGAELFRSPDLIRGDYAVVVDHEGHYAGIAVAEALIRHGMKVAYVSRMNGFAPLVEMMNVIEPALRRMAGPALSMHLRSRLIAASNDSVVIGPTYLPAADGGVRVQADIIVQITPGHPNHDLANQLTANGTEARVVGDARSPRFLQTAIHEAHALAGSL